MKLDKAFRSNQFTESTEKCYVVVTSKAEINENLVMETQWDNLIDSYNLKLKLKRTTVNEKPVSYER